MLRTTWPGREVRDTRDPGCRRTGLGFPVRHRSQFRSVVSWLVRKVRFSVLPGICSQEFRSRVPGTAGWQETGGPWQAQRPSGQLSVTPSSSSEPVSPHPSALLAWFVLFCSWVRVATAAHPGRPYLSLGTKCNLFGLSLPVPPGNMGPLGSRAVSLQHFLSVSTCVQSLLVHSSHYSGPELGSCDFLPPSGAAGLVPAGRTQGSEGKTTQRGVLSLGLLVSKSPTFLTRWQQLAVPGFRMAEDKTAAGLVVVGGWAGTVTGADTGVPPVPREAGTRGPPAVWTLHSVTGGRG